MEDIASGVPQRAVPLPPAPIVPDQWMEHQSMEPVSGDENHLLLQHLQQIQSFSHSQQDQQQQHSPHYSTAEESMEEDEQAYLQQLQLQLQEHQQEEDQQAPVEEAQPTTVAPAAKKAKQRGTAATSGTQSGGKKQKKPIDRYRNLYVSHLPPHYNSAALRELFSAFGKVQSAKVLHDEVSNQSKGIGFVLFDRGEDGHQAFQTMNQRVPEGGHEGLLVRAAHASAFPSAFRAGDPNQPSSTAAPTTTTTNTAATGGTSTQLSSFMPTSTPPLQSGPPPPLPPAQLTHPAMLHHPADPQQMVSQPMFLNPAAMVAPYPQQQQVVYVMQQPIFYAPQPSGVVDPNGGVTFVQPIDPSSAGGYMFNYMQPSYVAYQPAAPPPPPPQ